MFVEHKGFGEVTEATAKITTLSQAMREGSKLRGECRGMWLSNDGRSCAWTAAAIALGMDVRHAIHGSLIYNYLRDQFPTLTLTIFSDVVERMDCKNWSRLRCADWLEAQGF